MFLNTPFDFFGFRLSFSHLLDDRQAVWISFFTEFSCLFSFAFEMCHMNKTHFDIINIINKWFLSSLLTRTWELLFIMHVLFNKITGIMSVELFISPNSSKLVWRTNLLSALHFVAGSPAP